MNLRIVIVGLMMGAAEVVPGVSGGTIAFVSGFYDRLINAIQRFTPVNLWNRKHLGVRGLWRALDVNFLLVLFGSMLVSILVLARGVSYLLENQEVLIWSFFLGLVLASVYTVGKKLAPAIETGAALVTGLLLGYALTHIAPLEAQVSPFVLFAGGCVAVCAWILPGLSGSFILLILGLYQTVIMAIRDFELMTLVYVGAGCAVGIIAFSRLLSILLDRFRNATVAVLVGVMMGSLPKLWPWKRTTSYIIRDDGSQVPVVQESVSPLAYAELNNLDPHIAVAIIACLVGMAIILMLDRAAMLSEDVHPSTP